MDLQLKTVPAAIGGPALRTMLIADATAIEAEANRVAVLVPAAGGLTLGGVNKTSWPSAVSGSNGAVLQSGSVTLNGMDGVTVTHNKGDTSYLVKVMPTGTSPAYAGDISYVKAANSCVIYNTGRAALAADIELSAIA